VKFIAEHAHRTDGGLRWGVEPICTVLSEHGCPIAPSTYYDARRGADRPSRRQLRDVELKVEIARVHADNYGVYGARKTSHAVQVSSCGLLAGGLVGGEGDVLVEVLAGGEAMVQTADEAVEDVALGGDVLVAGGSATVVMGAGAG
jgi:hypothetical protein